MYKIVEIETNKRSCRQTTASTMIAKAIDEHNLSELHYDFVCEKLDLFIFPREEPSIKKRQSFRILP